MGDEEGLRHIVFPKEKDSIVIHADWKKGHGFFAPVKAQLRAYFSGELKEFELVLAPLGTPFQLKVGRHYASIPYGETGQLQKHR